MCFTNEVSLSITGFVWHGCIRRPWWLMPTHTCTQTELTVPHPPSPHSHIHVASLSWMKVCVRACVRSTSFLPFLAFLLAGLDHSFCFLNVAFRFYSINRRHAPIIRLFTVSVTDALQILLTWQDCFLVCLGITSLSCFIHSHRTWIYYRVGQIPAHFPVLDIHFCLVDK